VFETMPFTWTVPCVFALLLISNDSFVL